MGPSLDFISEICSFSMRRGSCFLAVATFLEEKSSRLFSSYAALWLKAPNRVSFHLLIFFLSENLSGNERGEQGNKKTTKP